MKSYLTKISIVLIVLFVVVGLVRIGARAVRLAAGLEPVQTENSQLAAGQSEIKTIEVEAFRYKPDMLQLKAGVPYRLKFVTNNVYSCIRSLVFPQLGIREFLPATGEKIVQLPALQSGQYQFMCAMGMYRGVLLVN